MLHRESNSPAELSLIGSEFNQEGAVNQPAAIQLNEQDQSQDNLCELLSQYETAGFHRDTLHDKQLLSMFSDRDHPGHLMSCDCDAEEADWHAEPLHMMMGRENAKAEKTSKQSTPR
jgi:hypothetical protein